MVWSWYVADDTQFYIVGAVILILATSHFKTATFATIALLLSSWLTTGYIALTNNHMPSLDDPLALFDKIYDKPWTRLGPYLIGMSMGYFLFKTDCKVKMSKVTNFPTLPTRHEVTDRHEMTAPLNNSRSTLQLQTTVTVGWLLSSACLLSLLYGLYETELSPIMAAAYSSLSHSIWALGLSWIVLACSTGYGGKSSGFKIIPSKNCWLIFTRFDIYRIREQYFVSTDSLPSQQDNVLCLLGASPRNPSNGHKYGLGVPLRKLYYGISI